MKELSIDAASGTVSVGNAVMFFPHRALPPDPLGVLTLENVRDMRTGYIWYDFLGATFAGDHPCRLEVCVFGGAVVHIRIVFLREDRSVPVWADHGQVLKEIAIGRFSLSNMLGRSFADGSEWFSWGVAWSQYDDKSGGIPSIGVRYDIDR